MIAGAVCGDDIRPLAIPDRLQRQTRSLFGVADHDVGDQGSARAERLVEPGLRVGPGAALVVGNETRDQQASGRPLDGQCADAGLLETLLELAFRFGSALHLFGR